MRSSNARATLDYADQQRSSLRAAHEYAMAAKECIFVAQDHAGVFAREAMPSGATGRAPSAGLRRRKAILARVDRDLARVRSILEQLDNALRDYEDRSAVASQNGERP